MDTLKSEKQEDYYGLFHESFSPLPIHVDTGFDSNAIIYKQVVTPLSSIGDTIFLKRWYGKSTTFTVDEEELNLIPNPIKMKDLINTWEKKNLIKNYMKNI